MSFSIANFIRNSIWFRRIGESLVREHPETNGEQVKLTQQNGVVTANVQLELEAIRTWLAAHVSGECSTAAATAAKTMSASGFVLQTDAMVCVKFTYTNTAASPTLNVNSTGAKPLYFQGAAVEAGWLVASNSYLFRYNGTQYDMIASDITAFQAQLATCLGLISTLQEDVVDLSAKFADLKGWCQTQGYS